MTTYEHAMLGLTGALAAGLHRRHGWPIVAMAGAVAVLPDWDGLSLVFGAELFDRCHRAWGHSLFSAFAVGAAVGAVDWRCKLSWRIGRRVASLLSLAAPQGPPSATDCGRWSQLAVWCLTGAAAAISHVAVDLLYSGHAHLADWGLKLFWPFSDRSWVFPAVPWGDVGTSLIFVAGMFAMLMYKRHVRLVACLTMASVIAYVLVRPLW